MRRSEFSFFNGHFSLLGDGCSLLILVNNKNIINLRREILLQGSVPESIMTPFETSSEKTTFKN
jgi:hypothetical protein